MSHRFREARLHLCEQGLHFCDCLSISKAAPLAQHHSNDLRNLWDIAIIFSKYSAERNIGQRKTDNKRFIRHFVAMSNLASRAILLTMPTEH